MRMKIELTKAIEAIGKILYEREHVEKETQYIHLIKCEACSKKRNLAVFFNQLYLADQWNATYKQWIV